MSGRPKKKKTLADKVLMADNDAKDLNDRGVVSSKKLKEVQRPYDVRFHRKKRDVSLMVLMAQYLLSNVGLFVGTWIYASLGDINDYSCTN